VSGLLLDIEQSVCGRLDYIIKKPCRIKQKNPTIIFLHGAGTRGTDISVLKKNPFFSQNSCVSDSELPFMIFAPLCNRNSWFDVFEQLQDFVKMVASHPMVDVKRLYLIGASMGGYAVWQLGMTMPEYFAAIVPICGGGMRWNIKRLINVPVWAFHGKEDATVPQIESVLMVDRLNEVGGNARLTLLDNTGHNSWDYAYAQQKLFDWLLQQEKENVSRCPDRDYTDSKRFG